MSKTLEIATAIVDRLHKEGFLAYFAGGWVRDFLLGSHSEEIDIATSAPPKKIQSLFPKTVDVGADFGVIVVVIEGQNFEVTTFRKDLTYVDGRHPESVDFSTPEHDAERRDFTINGMFYNPLTEEILDFVGGQKDLEKRIIRAIGDPVERFKEDRLRMLRAVRFSARFDFEIEKKTKEAIQEYASSLLPAVSLERIWQEWTKMSQKPHFDKAALLMDELGLLRTIFPKLERELKSRLLPFPYFPLHTPPVVYLLELFPDTTLQERTELAKYLKMSNAETKLIEFFTASEALFKKTPTKYEWVAFYAHPHSSLFLEIQGAKILPPHRETFLVEHEKRKKELGEHITRAKEKKPLVTAAHLQQKGIQPGPKMGKLLQAAEQIAIEEDLNDPREVIARLNL